MCNNDGNVISFTFCWIFLLVCPSSPVDNFICIPNIMASTIPSGHSFITISDNYIFPTQISVSIWLLIFSYYSLIRKRIVNEKHRKKFTVLEIACILFIRMSKFFSLRSFCLDCNRKRAIVADERCLIFLARVGICDEHFGKNWQWRWIWLENVDIFGQHSLCYFDGSLNHWRFRFSPINVQLNTDPKSEVAFLMKKHWSCEKV